MEFMFTNEVRESDVGPAVESVAKTLSALVNNCVKVTALFNDSECGTSGIQIRVMFARGGTKYLKKTCLPILWLAYGEKELLDSWIKDFAETINNTVPAT